MSLVEIFEDKAGVVLDIRYGSEKNFTGEAVYQSQSCLLHEKAMGSLQHAIKLAKNIGLRLCILDGFRPFEAQEMLWNHTPNPKFLSNPKTGTHPHCRGIAVDLTLIDDKENTLDMGTDFDAFTEQSFHGDSSISEIAQQNRYLLLGIMVTAGWKPYMAEWWHYQLPDYEQYPVLYRKDSPVLI